MLGAQAQLAGAGHPQHQGDLDLAPEEIAHLGGLIGHRVQDQRREVHELDLHDGPHAGHGETDSEARGGRLRKRPVPDPVLAELLAESPVDPEGPTVDADVLAQQDDVRVTAHFFPNRFVDGL